MSELLPGLTIEQQRDEWRSLYQDLTERYAALASITLTAAELREITGYVQAPKQKLYFDALGIPAVIKPDGDLSVVRAHLINYRASRAANDEPVKRVKQVR